MSQHRTTQPEEMATSFGYEQVAAGDKQARVDSVFHQVAERYDLMNDLMSAGMHRLWKDAMVASLAPPKRSAEPWLCLDVAGGTGDIAFRTLEASCGTAKVTVLDINGSMLGVGRERAEKKANAENLSFVEANAETLPFDSQSFDAYTIAFGIRNVPNIQQALNEAFRVLKIGGKFLCLEFSDVDLPILEKIYEQWSMHAIPNIGQLVTGDRDAYTYLVESIRKFPTQEDYAEMIRQAGFEQVKYRNYTGGIAALHMGRKL